MTIAMPWDRFALALPFEHGGMDASGLTVAPAATRPGIETTWTRNGLAVRALPSVTSVAQSEWDRLFAGKAEGWDYFRACERAAPAGFTPSAMGVFSGNTLVAAAPLFRTVHRLDMAMPDRLQVVGDWLNSHAPRFVNMPVLGLGSPLTEECPLGFLTGMSAAERTTTFEALLNGVSQHAKAQGISILALKDVTDRDAGWAHDSLVRAGYIRTPTLPVATLRLPFKTETEYLASLSANMRKDLKKKLRSLANVEVEIRHSIDGIENEIVALFEETRAKRNVQADYGAFEEVPAGYFRAVVEGLGDRAVIMLLRVNGELAGFNISLIEGDRIIGKYVGMRYPLATEHNIYFINWMMVVRLALERGVKELQVGQTAYRQKLRLGCQLKRSWVYFKHRGAMMGPLFRTFGPYFAFDRMDPDLREMTADVPYLQPEPAKAA